jgi:hypothetical protein
MTLATKWRKCSLEISQCDPYGCQYDPSLNERRIEHERDDEAMAVAVVWAEEP